MEKMYRQYKDIVEFRMVYMREAHAAGNGRKAKYAEDKGLYEHTTLLERCTTAQMLMDDKQLTIPCLIDSMDDRTSRVYSAQPDRVFLIRKDGMLGVVADKGPKGFDPGIDKVHDWLREYRKTSVEPALPEPSQPEPQPASGTPASSRSKSALSLMKKNDPGK